MPPDVATVGDAARRMVPTVQALGQEFARIRRELAILPELRLVYGPTRRCPDCRRWFKGPWQLRKHRRTAHG